MTAHHITGQLAVMSDEPERYEIRVTGHLAPRWGAWFGGMAVVPHDDGTTVIAGPVADQSELHGLLRKLSDLGLPLVSVALASKPAHSPRPSRSTT